MFVFYKVCNLYCEGDAANLLRFLVSFILGEFIVGARKSGGEGSIRVKDFRVILCNLSGPLNKFLLL